MASAKALAAIAAVIIVVCGAAGYALMQGGGGGSGGGTGGDSDSTGYVSVTVASTLFDGKEISEAEVTSGPSTVKAWDSDGASVEITGVPDGSSVSVTISFTDGTSLYGTIAVTDGSAYLSQDTSVSGGISFDGASLQTSQFLYLDSALDWTQWGGSTASYGVSDGKTVISASDMVELWSVGGTVDSSSTNWRTPGTAICVGSYTYYYLGTDSTLYCVETLTGDVVASVYCQSSTVYNMAIAYGDGKIFVPTKSGNYTVLRAYDAGSLEQLFVSEPVYGGEVQGSVTYHDGAVYFGTYGGDYACVPADDTDTSRGDEEVAVRWTISANGWYNATPAFFGELCVVVEKGYDIGGAVAYLVDTRTGAIQDTISLAYEYCTSGATAYDGRVYIAVSAVLDPDDASTESNTGKVLRIHSFEVSGGRFVDSSEKTWTSSVEDGGTQSTPVIWNGRLYIAGGGSTMGSSEPFTVIDIASNGTMTTAYTVSSLQSKGTATITTAYSTVDNNGLVYIYLIEYGHVNTGESADSSSGYARIYCLSDAPGQTRANIVFTYMPSVTQFAYQSFTISPEGCLLIRNDSTLFCYAPASSGYTPSDLVNAIDRVIADSAEGDVNYADVQRIEERYASMTAAEKAQVTNYGDLQDLYVTVTFVDGSDTITSKVLIGSLVATPSVDSLTFTGWMDGTDEWCVYTDRVTGDLTLTAAYASTVTVTFDSNGGTSVDSIQVVPGTVMGYATETARDGYTFGGWYSGSTQYVPQESVVNGSITLTARWLKDSTISFDSDGGTSVDSISATYGVAVDSLPTPTRSGYSFTGWYLDGVLFEEGTVYAYEHDVTLVAGWSENAAGEITNGKGVNARGVFPDDATLVLSQYSSSLVMTSITEIKNFAGTSNLDFFSLRINGDGVDGTQTVEIDLPVGTSLNGRTVTVYYYVYGASPSVTAVSGTVSGGVLTLEVNGATSSGGMIIIFGIQTGTSLSSSV